MSTTTLKDIGLARFAECSHQKNDLNDPNCIHCNMAWALRRINDLEFQQQKKEYDNTNLIAKIREVSPSIIGSYLGNAIAHAVREGGYTRLPAPDEFKSNLAAILLKYQRKGLFDNIFEKYSPKLLTEMSQDILIDLKK